MAQLVEQRIRNAQVIGSNPISSSIIKTPAIADLSTIAGVKKCLTDLILIFFH